MIRTKSLNLLLGSLLCGLSMTAAATTLSFDSGTNGTAVGSTYSASGIVFDTAFFTTAPYGSSNGSPGWVIGEPSGGYNGVGSVSVTGHFLGVTDFLSALSVYPDGNTISYLDVYDSLGNLLAGTSTSGSSLSISQAGISSFVFSWTGGGTSCGGSPCDDVIGIDNLTFNTPVANNVPEPASFALLGLALAGLGFTKRKTLKAA